MVNLQQLQGLHERLVVDTSEGVTSYLLVGQNGSNLKLSSNAYHLLRIVGSGVSLETLAGQLSRQYGRTVSVTEVETAYQHVIKQIAAIDAHADRAPFGFWFRMRCLPAAVVSWLARYLSIAFHPVVAAGFLAAVLTVIGLILPQLLTGILVPEEPESGAFWSVLLLYVISAIAHELGHASACARYGVAPKEIGMALYWIYPVFYTNVNAAWQLKRWQRVIVDCGGVYFQIIVGTLYTAIFLLYGWEPAWIAFIAIVFSLFFALNPILRFDGYWIIADALGSVNLEQQPLRILRHFYARLRGRPVTPLPWSNRTIALLALYSVFSISLWGYFTWRIGRLLVHVVEEYPVHLTGFIEALITPPHVLVPELLEAVFLGTLMLLGALLLTISLTRRLLSLIRSRLHRYQPAGAVQAPHH